MPPACKFTQYKISVPVYLLLTGGKTALRILAVWLITPGSIYPPGNYPGTLLQDTLKRPDKNRGKIISLPGAVGNNNFFPRFLLSRYLNIVRINGCCIKLL